MQKESHMKELKVIFGAHILSKNKGRQWGRLTKKLGAGDEGGHAARGRERRGEKEKGKEEEKGRGREERGRWKGRRKEGWRKGLSYSVMEHIWGMKFWQGVFPPASEASWGKPGRVFLGLFFFQASV